MLEHGGGDHPRAGRQLTVQADQLFLQQGQGLGHADQHVVEGTGSGCAGGHKGHGFSRQLVAREVFLQGQKAQVRVAGAGHLGVWRQAGGQRAKVVVEHQHAGRRRQALLVQVIEQVFVGGIEGLQGLVLLFRLAEQVELGERRSEYRHIDRRCFCRRLCATLQGRIRRTAV